MAVRDENVNVIAVQPTTNEKRCSGNFYFFYLNQAVRFLAEIV